LSLYSISAKAATINVPADQPTIAAAIAAASAGDEIILAAGTYTERGLIINKDLTISGSSAAATTIDADGFSGSIFKITAGTLTLNFLTFTGIDGSGWYKTALHNASGNLSVNNCLITGNTGAKGASIFQEGTACQLTVTNTTISGNNAPISGTAGIYLSGGNMDLVNVTITNNTALNSSDTGGLRIQAAGVINIKNSIIYGVFYRNAVIS